jgi:hypothetical protein
LRARAHRVLLAALFAVWTLVAWPRLSEQFSSLEQWRQRFEGRPLPERLAALDYPAYVVAEQVRERTPPDACILFLAYTGPEHVNYYKTRFDYYLYPRRVLVDANSGRAEAQCGFLAVFRDSPGNLKVEPFRGVWAEDELRQRVAALDKVHSGPHLDLYRGGK